MACDLQSHALIVLMDNLASNQQHRFHVNRTGDLHPGPVFFIFLPLQKLSTAFASFNVVINPYEKLMVPMKSTVSPYESSV
jgi:hypothetical protein